MGEMLRWWPGVYRRATCHEPDALLRPRVLAIGAATLLFRLPAQDINQLLCGDRLRRVAQHVHQVSYVVVA